MPVANTNATEQAPNTEATQVCRGSRVPSARPDSAHASGIMAMMTNTFVAVVSATAMQKHTPEPPNARAPKRSRFQPRRRTAVASCAQEEDSWRSAMAEARQYMEPRQTFMARPSERASSAGVFVFTRR